MVKTNIPRARASRELLTTMMGQTWFKSDLKEFQREFNEEGLQELLAITGDLYATNYWAHPDNDVNRPKERHWFVYLWRLMGDLSGFRATQMAEDYADELRKALENLASTYGPENVGETIKFNFDGSPHTDLCGKMHFDKAGKIITYPEQDKTYRVWKTIYADSELAPEPELFATFYGKQFWKITYFLPEVVELPARKRDPKDIRTYMGKHPKKVAAIYYHPETRYSRVQDKLYRRMGCIVADTLKEIGEYLRAHRGDFALPVPTFVYNSLYTVYRADQYYVEGPADKDLHMSLYYDEKLGHYMDAMLRDYRKALRFNHADKFIDISTEYAKKEERDHREEKGLPTF